MKLLLIASIVLIVVQIAHAAPFFFDALDDFDLSLPDLGKECSNLGCPDDSTSCSKKTVTSTDRKMITTEVKCLDKNGKVTKDETTEKENPNPDQQTYSFENFAVSSNIGGTFDHSVNINNNSNKGTNDGGDIEDFH